MFFLKWHFVLHLLNVFSFSPSVSILLKLVLPSASLDFLTLSFEITGLNEGTVSSLFKHYFFIKGFEIGVLNNIVHFQQSAVAWK